MLSLSHCPRWRTVSDWWLADAAAPFATGHSGRFTPAAWSCHAALGPTLRRAPAEQRGGPLQPAAERKDGARFTRGAGDESAENTHAVTSR